MTLDEDYKTRGVRSKIRILLSDYSEFKNNVVLEKEEFSNYYPNIKFVVSLLTMIRVNVFNQRNIDSFFMQRNRDE